VARVLVVDDNAGVRGAVRRSLAGLGHDIQDVPDGADALRLLEVSSFDLVITDAYMASLDGMELLARIQQRGIDVPVVVMSGGGFVAREDVLALARACGAVATLEKPFTPRQLRTVVESLLKRRPTSG